MALSTRDARSHSVAVDLDDRQRCLAEAPPSARGGDFSSLGGPVFPAVSVIVVGHNSRDWLDACLAALLEQDYPAPYDVIFVDNASDDDSIELVRRRFSDVRIVPACENLGYASGNNLGASAATGAVLAFLNPDTVVDSSWLTELVRALLTDRSVGLTTSKIVLMDEPERINTCGNAISLCGATTCRRFGELAATVVNDEDVPAVSGAAFAIRTALFRQLGGFDERFWMYVEDTDLSWRARMAGYDCRLAARSVVRHRYRLELTPAKTRMLERNRYLMLLKCLSLSSLVALLPLIVLGEVLTWGWAALRGPAHLTAKLSAAWWIARHLGEVRAARRAAQSNRLVSDRRVVAAYAAIPPVAEVDTGPFGRLVATVLVPLVMVASAIAFGALSLVSRSGDLDAAVNETPTFEVGD